MVERSTYYAHRKYKYIKLKQLLNEVEDGIELLFLSAVKNENADTINKFKDIKEKYSEITLRLD